MMQLQPSPLDRCSSAESSEDMSFLSEISPVVVLKRTSKHPWEAVSERNSSYRIVSYPSLFSRNDWNCWILDWRSAVSIDQRSPVVFVCRTLSIWKIIPRMESFVWSSPQPRRNLLDKPPANYRPSTFDLKTNPTVKYGPSICKTPSNKPKIKAGDRPMNWSSDRRPDYPRCICVWFQSFL